MRLLFDVTNIRGFNKILSDVSKSNVEKIYAAIAYTQDPRLVDICIQNNIRLEWWGLLNPGISTKINIIEKAIKSGLVNFYPLLDYFHPKVIYFENYGIYIGSANMTGKALRENIEAGVFIPNSELTQVELEEILSFFEVLEEDSVVFSLVDIEKFNQFQMQNRSSLDEMQNRDKQIQKDFREKFKNYGLRKPASEYFEITKPDRENKKRLEFTKEWNSAINELSKVADRLKEIEQPSWINSSASYAIITDQFLHAYYYSYVLKGKHKDDGKSIQIVNKLYDQNKRNPQKVLDEAINWWKNFIPEKGNEDIHINEWASEVEKTLAILKTRDLTTEEVEIVFLRNHAARNHARQIKNIVFNLDEGVRLNLEERTKKYAEWINEQKTKRGLNLSMVLRYLLFEERDILVERIYNVVYLDRYRLEHFGRSIVGELVGWARPDIAFLRNDRVNKALRCLGFDVKIFGE